MVHVLSLSLHPLYIQAEYKTEFSTAITESAVVHREIKTLREKIDSLERIVRESTPVREDKAKPAEKEEKKGKGKK